jgi:hypothetical protein
MHCGLLGDSRPATNATCTCSACLQAFLLCSQQHHAISGEALSEAPSVCLAARPFVFQDQPRRATLTQHWMIMIVRGQVRACCKPSHAALLCLQSRSGLL